MEHTYIRKYLKSANKVVMVCAQSNAAIDHIVRKIVKEGLLGSEYKIFEQGSNPKLLRLGSS